MASDEQCPGYGQAMSSVWGMVIVTVSVGVKVRAMYVFRAGIRARGTAGMRDVLSVALFAARLAWVIRAIGVGR